MEASIIKDSAKSLWGLMRKKNGEGKNGNQGLPRLLYPDASFLLLKETPSMPPPRCRGLGSFYCTLGRYFSKRILWNMRHRPHNQAHAWLENSYFRCIKRLSRMYWKRGPYRLARVCCAGPQRTWSCAASCHDVRLSDWPPAVAR